MSELVVDVGTVSAPSISQPDTTVASLIRQVESHLYTGTRVERDKLASGVTANATSLTTTYSRAAIKAGAKLTIDLEEYHVWSVSGATVTVQPGEFGSTSAAHDSGAIIHVNAEFSPFEIFREINNELSGLSAAGLFRTNSVTLAFNAARTGYDLTDVTNVDGILTVLAEATGPERLRSPIPWRLERNLDTDTFPSGFGLFLDRGWPGRDVFVVYKDQFGAVDSLADNVYASTGLPPSAHDLLAMGAALRLAAPAEIDRNQMSSQGGSRRANEVPAGSRVNAIRGLAGRYERRLVQEANRLKRAYPTRLPRRL